MNLMQAGDQNQADPLWQQLGGVFRIKLNIKLNIAFNKLCETLIFIFHDILRFYT